MESESKPYMLCVDDTPEILSAYQALFADEFVVSVATSVGQALALPELDRFDVVVSDYDLGDDSNDGLVLLNILRERIPTAGRVLVTGRPDDARAAGAVPPLVHDLIAKPTGASRLRDTVRRLARSGAVHS